MSVTRRDIDAIAKLARLDPTREEAQALAAQLDRILGYVAQLEELDVTDVPPTKHVIDLTNVDRDDALEPSLDRDLVLGQAPEAEDGDGRFVVPRVINSS